MACPKVPTHFTCPSCGKCLICHSHTHNPDSKGRAPYEPKPKGRGKR